VEALIASAIKEVYLRPERPPLMELWRAVGRQCLTRGLKTPAYRTVAARVRPVRRAGGRASAGWGGGRSIPLSAPAAVSLHILFDPRLSG
jgi:hypothetical protein